MDIGVNLARRVVSSVVQDEVSPPLLGVQTRPGGGRCDIPWVGFTLWAPSFLRGQLPYEVSVAILPCPTPLHSAWPGEEKRGPT